MSYFQGEEAPFMTRMTKLFFSTTQTSSPWSVGAARPGWSSSTAHGKYSPLIGQHTDSTLIGHRCGHCIHFAPTFKSLALDVHSWRGVMAVAAIDCAMEANMPTCREYEVMGYPTIKFFSPNTPAGDMGHERQNRSVDWVLMFL